MSRRSTTHKFTSHSSDWILALLFVDERKPIKGTLRIMKELFLFRNSGKLPKDTKIGAFYSFIPYDYGPCSFDIYHDLNLLKKKGDIVALKRPDRRYDVYMITDNGAYKAHMFLKRFRPSVLKALFEIKREFNDLSLYELLSYVYEKYPKYTRKSVFMQI
jgi:hypothetical protein